MRASARSIEDSVSDPPGDIGDGKTRTIENQLGREFDAFEDFGQLRMPSFMPLKFVRVLAVPKPQPGQCDIGVQNQTHQ